MSNETLKKVEDYLNSHQHLNLGTVTADGKPIVHTMAYASEGLTVYFVTNKHTRKAKNMFNNPAVAYTVDKGHYDSWADIQAVQAMGRAYLLEDKGEIEKVMGLLIKKFPQMANMPPDPDMIFFKIEPKEFYYLDNTVSFGHRDRVEL